MELKNKDITLTADEKNILLQSADLLEKIFYHIVFNNNETVEVIDNEGNTIDSIDCSLALATLKIVADAKKFVDKKEEDS